MNHRMPFLLAAALLATVLACSLGGATPDAAATESAPSSPVSLELTQVASHELPRGTHRPEILVTESGDIYLAVVQPEEGPPSVGQVRHRVYHFDSNWNQIGEPFPITYVTAEYGSPADHRAAIVNGELVVVYQSLTPKDTGAPPPSGPAEKNAKDQSLLLARFSLDGTELFRGPIVANAADFSQDNFPDHALVWLGDRLLVSTSGGQAIKFREVDLNANILATYTLAVSPTTGTSVIGNSLAYDGERLLLFSSGDQNRDAELTVSQLSADYQATLLAEYTDEALRQNFPTGNLLYEDFIFVAHIAQDRSGPLDLMQNPYDPYLKVLGADFSLVADLKIGEDGASHVHPTLARLGNRLFVAWSKGIPDGERTVPQVFVEEYEISSGPQD